MPTLHKLKRICFTSNPHSPSSFMFEYSKSQRKTVDLAKKKKDTLNIHWVFHNKITVHIIFIVSFHSRVKMNSTNWLAPNVWVFMAQFVEHCSANAEAVGSNPTEVLKIFFFRLICNCLNCNYHCDDHAFI